MKLRILMEDTPGTAGLTAEHGFCVYAETAHHRILADTGAGNATWQNAERLGIDISKVDTVILSHGHYDHTGGVMGFAEKNRNARIYMHPLAAGAYYNLRDGNEKYIGIDPAILNLEQTVLREGTYEIDEEIAVFGNVTEKELLPKGNSVLKKKVNGTFGQDTFDHEQYTVLRENGKTVLISGCAHNGIRNILERYRDLYGTYPNAVVSGFHMMKNGEYDDGERAVIRATAEYLRTLPCLYFTGHCTSLPAYDIMKEILHEQLIYVHTGEEIIDTAP